MTLTFELGLDSVTMNRHTKYSGQRSFCSKVIVGTDGHRHTHLTDCSIITNRYSGPGIPGPR